MGAVSRIAMVLLIAVALVGCSTSLTTRDKDSIAGRAPRGNAVQGSEQRLPPQSGSPPPLRVVVASPPPVAAQSSRYVWIPEWGVYLLEENDIVYSEGYHYYFYEGHWYVARSWAGPWALIASPPPTLAAVPPGSFHKRLPPGLAQKDMMPPGHMH